MNDIITMSADDLGIHGNSDRIYEALIDREGDRRTGSCVLGVDEIWDYGGVTDGWLLHIRDHLAPHGIRYDLDTDTAVLPAALTAHQARQACADVVAGFESWIDQVVDEVRSGKADPEEWDARSEDDSGARWVRWNPS
ncbi:hypothetical protein ACH4PU_30230 [Streptomyces sp. NPDC021100]|uniref:hypothetical protein n=1 Tax=Streptomyces sp. NPDC021100 TaxID=3365114 RepID=UPI0037AB93A0